MPNLGHTMARGRVQQWLKAPGEAVRKGDGIALVESDKVTVEIEAPADGWVLRVLTAVDEDVPVGGTLALIGRRDEATEAERMVERLAGGDVAPVADGGKTAPAAEIAVSAGRPSASVRWRRRTSPLAGRLARRHRIDLSAVSGSGPQGLVLKADILRTLRARADGSISGPTARGPSPVDRAPLSGRRAVIAERMAGIWREAPMVTLVATADVSDLLASPLVTGADLGINDFVLCACARALAGHCRLNAWLTEGQIERHEAVHLAFAVALDDGLITPVIRDADRLCAEEMGLEVRRLSGAARGGRLLAGDMSAATFTVSNLGGMGIDVFTPILNPPQVGILGVGRVRQEATLTPEGVAFRRVLSLCLVFDHRALDGVDGARFLQDVQRLLAKPRELLAASTAGTRQTEAFLS